MDPKQQGQEEKVDNFLNDDKEKEDEIQKSQGKCKTWLAVILTTLITAAAAGGGAFYFMQQILESEEGKAVEGVRNELQSKVDELEKKEEAKETEMEEQITSLKNKNKALSDNNEISCSETNLGWKKYTPNDVAAFSTSNWKSYSPIDINTSFLVEYPNDWKLDGSVFYDVNNNKVAEFSPSVIFLESNQKCFDSKMEESNQEKLLSQADIEIGKRQGVVRVLETIYSGGGRWYPNQYCLMEEDRAFIMTFYERELGSVDKALFEKIISTLELK